MRLDTGAAMKRVVSTEVGSSHGTLTIFSVPRAVTRHVEWNLSSILDYPLNLNWRTQTLDAGAMKTSLQWSGVKSTAQELASMLRGWHYVTFEILEFGSSGSDGALYMCTPELGLFVGSVGPHGDIMVNENQITRLIDSNRPNSSIFEELEKCLGRPWDGVLETYRRVEFEDDENGSVRLSV